MDKDSLKLLVFLESTEVSLTRMIKIGKEATNEFLVYLFNRAVDHGIQRNEQQVTAIFVLAQEFKRRFSYDPLLSRLRFKLNNFEKLELVDSKVRPEGCRAPDDHPDHSPLPSPLIKEGD